MIVLHPNSVCDVCLEGYGGPTVPHAIACGHIFCQRCGRCPCAYLSLRLQTDSMSCTPSCRCLWSLTRQSCPLCRTPFQPEDIRKLHMDRCSRPNSPDQDSTPGSPDSDYNEFPSEARDFHHRITRIVLDGAKATEVRDFLEEVKDWLTTQQSDDVSRVFSDCHGDAY